MEPFKAELARPPKFALLVLALIFLAALGGRLYLLHTYPHVLFLHEADFQVYFANARSIIATHSLSGISIEHPPFYSFLIVLAYPFSSDIESAARLVSAVMGGLLVVPVYFLCRQVAGWRIALITAATVASFGVSLDYSQQPITISTYLTLIMGCMASAMATATGPTRLRAALTGFLCGTLYLTRPEGIIVFGYLALVFAGVYATAPGEVPLNVRLRAYGTFCFVYLLTIMPYLVFIRVRNGQWMLSGKARTVILGVDGGAKLQADGRTLVESVGKETGIANLVPSLSDLASNFFRGLSNFARLIPENLPVVLLWCALLGAMLTVGMTMRAKSGERRMMFWKLALLLTGCVAVLPAFAFPGLSVVVSYILPVFPLLLFFICAAFRWCELIIARVMQGIPSAASFLTGYAPLSIICAGVLCFSLAIPYVQSVSSAEYRFYCASQEFFIKDTGLWLKHTTPPDAVVMTRWGLIGHYAERPWAGLVDGEIQEVIDYARKHSVRYIVIDSNSVPRRRPKLEPLLDPNAGVPGLRPVYARMEYGILIIIYEMA